MTVCCQSEAAEPPVSGRPWRTQATTIWCPQPNALALMVRGSPTVALAGNDPHSTRGRGSSMTAWCGDGRGGFEPSLFRVRRGPPVGGMATGTAPSGLLSGGGLSRRSTDRTQRHRTRRSGGEIAVAEGDDGRLARKSHERRDECHMTRSSGIYSINAQGNVAGGHQLRGGGHPNADTARPPVKN